MIDETMSQKGLGNSLERNLDRRLGIYGKKIRARDKKGLHDTRLSWIVCGTLIGFCHWIFMVNVFNC